MSAMTLLSRVFGYVRDLLQAAILGAADLSDAYVIAFRIPNLLRRLLGEGALTASFIPVFTATRRRQGEAAAWRLAATSFWALALLLALLTAVGMVAAPWIVRLLAYGFGGIEGKTEITILLTRIMFPYLLFIGLAALAMAVLNSVGVFAAPAFTPVLLNLSIIGFAVLFGRHSPRPAIWFAVGVLVGGAMQLFFQIPFLLRHGMKLWPRLDFGDPRLRQVGWLMLPGLFGVGVTQLNLIVDSQVASFLGTGSVSYLYYAVRVEELVMGVFVVSFSTVILPALSRHAAAGRDDLMHQVLERGLRFVAYVTLPAMVGLWVLREPIINTLFERGSFMPADTTFTAWALALYGLGLLPNGMVKILAPAFYARFDTRTPVMVGALAFAVHIPMCIGLAVLLGHAGIALSTSVAALLNAAGLLFLLVRRERVAWGAPLALVGLRLALAALGMGGVLVAVVTWAGFDAHADLPTRALWLAIMIAVGSLVYLLLGRLLGAREGRQIWAEVRGRSEGSGPTGS